MKINKSLIKNIPSILFPKAYFNYLVKKSKPYEKGTTLTISFDCDYKKDIEAIPQLLGVLSSYPFKTCFASIGKWIEKFPRTHERILEEGHEIINHSYTHPDNEELNPNKKFNELSLHEIEEEIKNCHETCINVLDYAPKGFRTPHFGRLQTNKIYPILEKLGYKYSSSTMAVKTGFNPFKIGSITEFPLSPCPKHHYGVFDTWHAFRAKGTKHSKKEFIRLFQRLIQTGKDKSVYINVYFDPQDIKKFNFSEVLDFLSDENIEVKKYEELL